MLDLSKYVKQGELNLLVKWKEKYIGDAAFYKRYIYLALPMILQNAITNLVSFLDNIMVGQLGTEQMSGVAIVNQLIFVYNLAIFGAVSAASIFGAQYFGKGNHEGHMHSFRFKMYATLTVTALTVLLFVTNGTTLISLYLTKECFETKIVNDGELALKEFQTFRPNLILLDLMLPGIDGYQVCREIRHTSDVPIIMLSAKGETFDKVLGLELGADDYIIKPFDSKELVARVRAVLRRFQPKQAAVVSDEKCATYPDLIVNLTNYSVTYMGKQVDMPPKELELLYFLASSPNQVFTREQLLDHIWGYEYIGDTRTVDVHIKRLREKIKDHPNWSISTVWGIGYKFEVKSE